MRLNLSQHPAFQHLHGQPQVLEPRDAAMLAWLALEGPTSRARLAALLWPDSESKAARNALRQRLFRLTRQCGEPLVAGSTTLALAESVTHDLEHSDSVLGDALHAHSAEFSEWLTQQRERRRHRARDALVGQADVAEAAKDFAEALAHAQALLALEPLSEAAYRRVIRLNYLAGDRAAALLAFDACEQMLKNEVGAKPSAETMALLATIDAEVMPAALQLGNAVPASVLRPPRLIGRDRELAALSTAWRSAQVVALIGEAGLGKTRLLQAFIDTQFGVARAAGRPGDAGVPFATLARLLRAVIARSSAAVDVLLPATTRSQIARVLPELDGADSARAGEGAGGAHTGEGQRLVMQRAVRALLQAQSGLTGLTGLVVDDLHFADEASLEMLRSLIDGEEDSGNEGRHDSNSQPIAPRLQSTDSGLRWALAFRPAEASSPVQLLQDGLVDQARLLPLALQPLDEAALAELVDSLGLPGLQGKVLAPGLRRRTGGNPLFVLETLKQAWVERTLGELADAQQLPRPLSVGRLIERRMAQLSPGALALARVASIAEVDFSIAMAEQVLGATAMQFADALNELEAAQVLRDTAFAHDLVFDAVRGSVPAAIARHTHAAVAGWLEAHGGEPARIARHWTAGAQSLRAVPWLEKAAQAAGAATRRKEQFAFLQEKGDIEAAAGDTASAFESLMRACELMVTFDSAGSLGPALCDRMDALAREPDQRVRVLTQRAALAVTRGDAAKAETAAAAGLEIAIRHGCAQHFVFECRNQLATALCLQERLPEAIRQFEAMLGWIDEHGDDERRCDFHGNLAMTYDSAGRLAESVPHHELAIELAQRLNDHGNQTQTIANFACNRILGGRLVDGEALLSRARRLRTHDELPASIDGFIAMTQSICDYQRGRYSAALRALDEGMDRLAEFSPGYRPVAVVHQAVCWAQLGQWARMTQAINSLADLSSLSGGSRCRVALLHHQMAQALSKPHDIGALNDALLLAEHARLPDIAHAVALERAASMDAGAALIECERVLAVAQELGHDATQLAAHAQAARAAASVGNTQRARHHVDAVITLIRTVEVVRQYRMEPWLHAAVALTQIGESDRAQALCREACDWIQHIAHHHVPEAFRDSFLHRNPVNRALLALQFHRRD